MPTDTVDTTRAEDVEATGGLKRWRRIAVIAIIVSLSVTALVGIFALLFGTFNELQGRIMLTTALIGAVSILALCDLARIDRGFRWISVTGLAVTAVTLLAGLVLVWFDWSGGENLEALWKTFGLAGVAAVSAAHASLLLLLGGRTNPVVRFGLWVTLALIGILYLLLAALILTNGEIASDGYARLVGTVAILDVLGTIVVPVVALFLRDSRPAPVSAASVGAPTLAAASTAGPASTMRASDDVTSFRINVADAVLADLHDRLARTRFIAPTPGQAPWAAGMDPAYLRELVGYWIDGFDWRAREAWLNSFPQFLATIEGQTIHYVHVRGRGVQGGPAPMPLIVSHGWPYSFADMLGLVPLLTDPAAHGGSAADAFDVIIPSLPGYGFSDAPSTPCIPETMADILHRLMTERLGYARYGTYGEDVGGHVSDWLAAKHPESVIGIHASHPAYPAARRRTDLTAGEAAFTEWLAQRWDGESAYSEMQRTKPDTVAAALNDSPAGLAAWIVEKFRGWSDSHGDVETRFSKDQLLTTVMLYWVTGSIGSSFRAYHDGRFESELPLVTVPAGI
ncbi:MAG TPA: epoxide hydrolase, partial [Glaciibacter sp.]|nr:epoxide hydrolase [Glaciibacter sp.]